jgi:NAD(P)-dependent dehydrogenase (short-subunit alcohol dehydrogenase family)
MARAAELAGKSPQEAQKEVEKAKLSLGKAEGVAKVLAFLASDEASYVTGTIFTR